MRSPDSRGEKLHHYQPPHFYCFPSTTITTTTTATTFLLFSLHHHNHLISIVFPPRNFIRDYQLPFLIHFVAMPRVVNNNRGFLQLLADFPAYQHRFRRCHYCALVTHKNAKTLETNFCSPSKQENEDGD